MSVSLTYNRFLSQYQGTKGPGQDRSPRALPWPEIGHQPHRAASSRPQQDVNDGFQISHHQMNQKTVFSGRKKDPVFLGKNRLTHLGQIFQWKEILSICKGRQLTVQQVWCCGSLLTNRGQKTCPKDRQNFRLDFITLWAWGSGYPVPHGA